MAHNGWTVGSDRLVEASIAAAPAVVRDFYADLQNITELHPLVVSVRLVEEHAEGDGGHVRTYRVRDRIPFGPLRLPIVYTAQIAVPGQGDVRTEARQFPAVRLSGVVSFEPAGAGTRLVERLRIEAPRPLARLTVRQAVAAHAEMLAGIRRHFA